MEKYSPRNLVSSARGALDNFIMEVRRKTKDVPIMLCVILLTSLFHIGGTVWSAPAGHMPYKVYFMGIPVSLSANGFCKNLKGLTSRQLKYCRKEGYRTHMAQVLIGANLALEECENQFKNNRWNCSLSPKDSENVFKRITGLNSGTRESGFTYAIASAGVTWAISRACAEGNLSDCGCGFQACDDNIKYGMQFSTKFLDEYGESVIKENSSREKKARTLMNSHNNNVGRKFVSMLRRRLCRCHGPTGGCAHKTCFRKLPAFHEVGDALHEQYRQAVRVELHKSKSGKEYLKPVRGYPRSFADRLVYLANSPTYCNKNSKLGFSGTQGRKCGDENSCELLCCGRGYTSRKVNVIKKCQCKFEWCCKVKCLNCEEKEVINRCL